LILVNNLGNVAYLNSFAENLFQYNRSELIGRNVETLIPVKFKDGHSFLIQSYLKNPVQRQMGANRELKAIKKDGSEFPVEIGLNPIVTAD
jgi:PAS domain S-box-containing protein